MRAMRYLLSRGFRKRSSLCLAAFNPEVLERSRLLHRYTTFAVRLRRLDFAQPEGFLFWEGSRLYSVPTQRGRPTVA